MLRQLEPAFTEYRAWAQDPTPRIGWGLSFFDSRTNGGIGRSETCMIMACSSVGKTAIGLNVIREHPDMLTAIFSLEMSWRMLAARLAAMHTGCSTQMLEQSLKGGTEPKQIRKTVNAFPNLWCDDTPALTLRAMAEDMEQIKETVGVYPRIVLIDYLELVGGNKALVKAEAVDRVAQEIRNWTRHHDCTTIILHQVGKGGGGEGGTPIDLSSGRYGGHQPVDFVVGAYAPRLRANTMEEFNRVRHELFLQLLKNRAGEAHPVGIRHRLDATCLRLSEWDAKPWKTESSSGSPVIDEWLLE